jgi:hypothetical protein
VADNCAVSRAVSDHCADALARAVRPTAKAEVTDIRYREVVVVTVASNGAVADVAPGC